jgi:multidrug efflux pump subunit AcrA (membrane-fusion protein)
MSPFPHELRRRTPVAAATAAVAVVVALALVGSSAGADGQSARERRAEVRAQQASVAAQVDALQGDQADIDAALAALDENVRGQQAALSDARNQVAASTAAAADQAIAETQATVDALRAKVVSYAVDAYITPPDEDLIRRLEAPSAQEDATKRALLQLQSGNDADVLDQLRAARQRLDDEKDRAESARARAEAAAAEAEQALASFTAAQAQQQAFAAQVRDRLDASLAEAANLSRLDAELGRQIAAEQAALAARVTRVSPAAPPTGGGTTGRAYVAPPPLVTVGGITVNASIGDQLRGLLQAAQADGIFLNGYGWRDTNNQIALRMQNCGTSDYAVWHMPPDGCSPPTARPGTSMHERGLAIDFSVNGRFIKSRSDPAFVWLAANAGRFGFINLPSEPWHWSTTGG